MEKYLIGLMFFASAVHAQVDTATVQVHCVGRGEIDKVLNDYDEYPFVRGFSIREYNGVPTNNSIVLFVNATTGTWTLVERTPDRKYCIISTGTKFEAVPLDVIDEMQKQRKSNKM